MDMGGLAEKVSRATGIARMPGAVLFVAALVVFLSGGGMWGGGIWGSRALADRLVDFSEGGASEIMVPYGQSSTIRTTEEVGDILVGDKEIADVLPLTDRSLYILGKKPGRTNVAVYDRQSGLIGVIDIEVGVDTRDLSSALRQAAPSSQVLVQSVNGRLRLSGSVPDGLTLQKVLDIAQQYTADPVINSIRVLNAQQVLLEVRFIEARRDAGRDLGVSWSVRDRDTGLGLRTGRFFPPTSIDNDGVPLTQIISPFIGSAVPFGTFVARVLDEGVIADVLIQALEDKGLARRLAEPNLTALSGETAQFLAGGEVPIPVAQDDNTISIEFKKYGVLLQFTPVVLDDGTINLRLAPEVSQVDFTNAIRTQDIEVPAFIVRNAQTTVELNDGQSFAIAGLLQSDSVKTQEQVPWLGQLPVLGALFRSSSFLKQETDLVIIVTPHLVRPAKPGEPLKTPLDSARPSNDPEFFALGMLEVNDKMLRSFEEGAGVVGPFGHIIELPPGQYNAYTKY